MAEQFTNAASSTLASAIGAGDATLTVASATGFPTTGNFRIIVAVGTTTPPTNREICTVTSVAGAVFTISRASEVVAGVQTALAHVAGELVTHVLTAGALAQGIADQATGSRKTFAFFAGG